MGEHPDLPIDVLDEIRAVCLALPETGEEPAWVGMRWVIRARTFAHVLVVESGWPPAYARAAGSDGPITVLTFQSPETEIDTLVSVGHPFFRPRWRPNIVGMVIDAEVDWVEVAELLTESYCTLAPASLVRLLDRPPG